MSTTARCQGADVASDDEHHWEDEENEDLHKDYVDELAEDSQSLKYENTYKFTTQRNVLVHTMISCYATLQGDF